VSLSVPGRGTVMIDELSGLWHRRPWLALGMGVMMMALLGFPIFGGMGFLAKWYILQVALHAPVKQVTLSIVLVLTTVISAGYYLYVVMVMFMRQPAERTVVAEVAPSGRLTRGVLFAAAILILLLGVAPDALVRITRSSRVQQNAGAVVPIGTIGGIPILPPAQSNISR
jgi:NADH-quinone oxidoreductase subunit N